MAEQLFAIAPGKFPLIAPALAQGKYRPYAEPDDIEDDRVFGTERGHQAGAGNKDSKKKINGRFHT